MKLFLPLTLFLASSLSAGAVATNHALTLSRGASVNCGSIESLSTAKSYAIQLWANADNWNPGDVILSLGNTSLTLENPGFLNWGSLSINSEAFAPGNWFQLTILADAGNNKVYVNGQEAETAEADTAISGDASLTIGGSFDGRIDELRVWNAIPDAGQFNWFINNTINRWNPFLENLAAYYKFDQKECPQVVEQTAIWAGLKSDNTEAGNNHGIISGEARKEPVLDNPVMKYRVNGAYTANARFYDRAIPRDQYLLSNDLIILGIQSYDDGHLEYLTPNNRAGITGNVKYLDEFEGRKSVIELNGEAYLTADGKILSNTSNGYTIEGNIYVDKWVDGAVIISKTDAEGNGISITLGKEENHEVFVNCDGNSYKWKDKFEAGKWHNFGIYPNLSTDDARQTFIMAIDGTSQMPSRKESSEVVCNKPSAPDAEIIIGKGFIGKLDDILMFEALGYNSEAIYNHSKGNFPMPGLSKQVTATLLKDKNQCAFLFNKPEDLGFNTYSQDSWREIMSEAYAGHDGWECRISVQSHAGWENTIANAEKRKIFAEDLARLSKGYDGVELDLEWIYGTQTNLGKLAEDIRKVLPEDKTLMISCHNVAYQFPKDKMEFVDGFTFQQYGPQNIHSQWSQFKTMCRNFQVYGFPDEKIIGSYATTTSKGYQDGSPKVAISGVRSGFLDGDYEPSDDMDSNESGGYTYYFCSPVQVFRRANHIVENGLGGIFYWDMGNDVPVEHKYNMAKWASYGINSNVEPIVKEVNVNHAAAVEIVSGVKANSITYRNGVLKANGEIRLMTIDGKQVAYGQNTLSTLNLPSGIYIAVSGDAEPLKIVVSC